MTRTLLSVTVCSVIALGAGCSRGPEAAPRDTPSESSMKPSEALARYLKTARPGMAFEPEPMAVDIDGWAFFRAARPEERDGGDEFFVVRADGTVVGHAERAAELSAVLAAVGLKGDPARLARAVLALTTYAEVLVEADDIPHLGAVPVEGAVEPPRLTAAPEPALVFWSRRQSRGGELLRRVVTLRDGSARVKVETPEMRPAP